MQKPKNRNTPNASPLQLSLVVLAIAILISLQGITFVGSPETFTHNYGWPSLAFIITITAGIAVYYRKYNKKLSVITLGLSAFLLVLNIAITNIFTY